MFKSSKQNFKVSTVEIDSSPSNSIETLKFNNYIMNFQKFRLNFYNILLKKNLKINLFCLTFKLHLFLF